MVTGYFIKTFNKNIAYTPYTVVCVHLDMCLSGVLFLFPTANYTNTWHANIFSTKTYWRLTSIRGKKIDLQTSLMYVWHVFKKNIWITFNISGLDIKTSSFPELRNHVVFCVCVCERMYMCMCTCAFTLLKGLKSSLFPWSVSHGIVFILLH